MLPIPIRPPLDKVGMLERQLALLKELGGVDEMRFAGLAKVLAAAGRRGQVLQELAALGVGATTVRLSVETVWALNSSNQSTGS